MKHPLKFYFVLFFSIALSKATFSQIKTTASFGKGIKLISPDSSMSIHFTARFQTLYQAEQSITNGEFNDDFEDEMMIRRSRFKFDGFVLNPKVVYKFELGFANRDMGIRSPDQDRHFSGSPGYILDAVLKYNFYKNFVLWFGQTKLPGNQERVVSSQQLQFVDRSLVNNYFNLDRDVGIQLHHKSSIGGIGIRSALAATLGEGRNVTSSDNKGKSYTARLDILPLGEFTKKGDFFGSDLERETNAKLLIGGSYNLNQKARRSAGQLGNFIPDSLMGDFGVLELDATFKYKGFSSVIEVAERSSISGPSQMYFIGRGYMGQAGYLLNNNLEFAGRYTKITPKDSQHIEEYTLGISKYFVGHSLKIQSDASYVNTENSDTKGLRFRFQVEMQF